MLEEFRSPFENRTVAGRALGERLARMKLADPVVLALPRGGVPVGLEVARALHAPLDLLLVRKIGVPWQPELAVGAVMDGGAPVIVVEPRVMAETGIDRQYIEECAQQELKEIERRRAVYLAHRAPEPVAGRTAIVVDDGIATGATMRAALRGLRQRKPARLVLAVPVAPPETIDALRAEVDDVVCLMQPGFFGAIGYFYIDFHQLTDDEVIDLMRQAPRANEEPSAAA
jgi:putative phosphoribosyl transferase